MNQRDLLERKLDAKVTSRDHHGVKRVDNRLEVGDCLWLLDLGDHGQANTLLFHDLVDPVDICGVTHEGKRHHVRRQSQRPPKVRLVLLRQRGHADCHAGQVDALVVGDDPADNHLADDVGDRDLKGLEADLAVIDQQPVSGLHVTGQPLVGR